VLAADEIRKKGFIGWLQILLPPLLLGHACAPDPAPPRAAGRAAVRRLNPRLWISEPEIRRDWSQWGCWSSRTAWSSSASAVRSACDRARHLVATALAKLGIDHRPCKGGHGGQAPSILPWAHTVFGNLKTWLRGTSHGVSPKPLQRYRDEFSYRFDRRWREGELFGFVLRRVVGGEPLPYRRLVAEGTA
jgi:hypothetical protein